jgi:hypothetical protein
MRSDNRRSGQEGYRDFRGEFLVEPADKAEKSAQRGLKFTSPERERERAGKSGPKKRG